MLFKYILRKMHQTIQCQCFKYPDINSVVSMVSATMKIPESDKLKSVLKVQLNTFKRMAQSNRRDSVTTTMADDENEIVIDSDSYSSTEVVAQVSNSTTDNTVIRKAFVHLGQRMQRQRTQHIVDLLNDFVTKEEGKLTMSQLLGSTEHIIM